MRKLPIIEHSKIKKLIADNVNYFTPIVNSWENDGYTQSKIHSRLTVLRDICELHGYDIALLLYDEYWNSGTKRKIEIRYGDDRAAEYANKLQQRPRPEVWSILTKKYWTGRGYSDDEAESIISKIQTENVRKRTKASYSNWSLKCRHSIDYWTNLGYNEEEAVVLREPYLVRNSLDAMISRYGESEGLEKYTQWIEKYKNSMKANFGNRRTGGFVSTESKKFFVPIYKKLRRMGFQREEIYFGISGSREFFLRKKGQKNAGRFVDFCVPSIKLIIEYHGTFWHPKSVDEWKNPFIDYDIAIKSDNEVEQLSLDRGFDYVVVWSDDDLNQKSKEIVSIIERKLANENIGCQSVRL
jgi:G:T-mismatch repair DNA endonuclease (very short patch repair protein)